MMDMKRLNTLKRVLAQGYTEEKRIVALNAEDMAKFCKSIPEILAIVELQKAISTNSLISYLAGKEIQ